MSLNDYRDEVKDFLEEVKDTDESMVKQTDMLEEELELLREADEDDDLRHQIYDILFILFAMAAKKDLDLDEEWRNGRKKKRKYVKD
ncbi:MAG: hypothetical protein ACLFTY_04045 [Candidatus Aenigmatarchaeota archaeon]